LAVGEGIFAGHGGEVGGGFDGGVRVDEIGNGVGGEDACSEGGGGGEEAAAVLVALLDLVLGSDLGGRNDGAEFGGVAEKHCGSLSDES